MEESDGEEMIVSSDDDGSSCTCTSNCSSTCSAATNDDDEPILNENEEEEDDDYYTDAASSSEDDDAASDLDAWVIDPHRADRYEIRPARLHKDRSYDDGDDDSSSSSGEEEVFASRGKRQQTLKQETAKVSRRNVGSSTNKKKNTRVPSQSSSTTTAQQQKKKKKQSRSTLQDNDESDTSSVELVVVCCCSDTDDDADEDAVTVEAEVVWEDDEQGITNHHHDDSVEVTRNNDSDDGSIGPTDTSHFSPNTSVERLEHPALESDTVHNYTNMTSPIVKSPHQRNTSCDTTATEIAASPGMDNDASSRPPGGGSSPHAPIVKPQDDRSSCWMEHDSGDVCVTEQEETSTLSPILERSGESSSSSSDQEEVQTSTSSSSSPGVASPSVQPDEDAPSGETTTVEHVTQQLATVTFRESAVVPSSPSTTTTEQRKQQQQHPLDDDDSVVGAPMMAVTTTQDDITRSMKKPTIRREGSIQQGQWKLAKKIGQGAFGVVHLGMDTTSGSFFAVKSARMDPVPMRDAKREIQLLRSLRHPNIVHYIGAEMNRNYLHIFQEWVPAGSLTSVLALLGPFPLPVLQQYLGHIVQGLLYLHQNNVIHRDIKGSNILVTDTGVVKLADFGAGKQLQGMHTDAMMTMTCRGTPYFMAPEVFEEKYSTKADIWSVGCVIVQMATGSPPWKDIGLSNPVALFRHISSVDGDPPVIPYDKLEQTADVLNHEIKVTELQHLVTSCFHKNPQERPNAKELTADPFLVTAIAWDHAADDGEHCRRLFSPSPASGKVATAASNRQTPSPRKLPSFSTQRRSSIAGPPPRSPSPVWSSSSSGRQPQQNHADSKEASTAILFSPTMDPSDWPSWAAQQQQQHFTNDDTGGGAKTMVSADSLAYTGSDQGGKENSMSSTLAGIGFVELAHHATTGTSK